MVRRNVLTVVGAAAMGLAMVMPALAVQDDTQAVVTGGTLSMSGTISVGDFDGVDITGEDQTTTATLNAFYVEDLRGSGVGWKVNVSATQFETADQLRQLGLGSLDIAAPGVTAEGTDSPLPTVTAGTIDGGSAHKLASAAVDAGMGKYNFGAAELTLSLPADVYAGTYSSIVTVDVASAP